MKYAATALPATLLALLCLIQPCPAPPVVVGVGMAAGGILGAGAAMAGFAAAATSDSKDRRRQLVDASGFDQCVAQGINSTQRVDLLANSSVVVSGLPLPCMAAIDEYNRHPLIGDLNSVHGSTNVISADSVRLDDMPHYVITAIVAAQFHVKVKPSPSPSQDVGSSS